MPKTNMQRRPVAKKSRSSAPSSATKPPQITAQKAANEKATASKPSREEIRRQPWMLGISVTAFVIWTALLTVLAICVTW